MSAGLFFRAKKRKKSIRMKRCSILLIFLAVINAGAATDERLAVVAPVANIRSGPGTQYDILWKVEKYYPLLVIEKSES
jgi:uncharacterized protein YraI